MGTSALHERPEILGLLIDCKPRRHYHHYCWRMYWSCAIQCTLNALAQSDYGCPWCYRLVHWTLVSWIESPKSISYQESFAPWVLEVDLRPSCLLNSCYPRSYVHLWINEIRWLGSKPFYWSPQRQIRQCYEQTQDGHIHLPHFRVDVLIQSV